jgi:hypothetical protein
VAGGVHLGVVQGFKHDGAVAWALVPALALAASAGGTVCLWTLTVGAMLSYTLDALRMREACLSAIWGTLLLVDIGLLFSSQVIVPVSPWTIHRPSGRDRAQHTDVVSSTAGAVATCSKLSSSLSPSRIPTPS